MSVFVDSNVFIYFVSRVDEQKADRCLAVLSRAENAEEDLVTSELVIAEVVWLLQRRTVMTRDQIRDFLLPLIELPGLRVPQRQLWPRVFDIYCTTPADFTDAYNAAWMERTAVHQIYSYDRDFDAIGTVERLEP